MSDEIYRTFHCHLDLYAAINWPDEKLTGMLKNAETGETLSPEEVRDFFLSEMTRGYKYFSACDNRDEDGMCAGHPVGPCPRCNDTGTVVDLKKMHLMHCSCEIGRKCAKTQAELLTDHVG